VRTLWNSLPHFAANREAKGETDGWRGAAQQGNEADRRFAPAAYCQGVSRACSRRFLCRHDLVHFTRRTSSRDWFPSFNGSSSRIVGAT
jgi:hypothetical protein